MRHDDEIVQQIKLCELCVGGLIRRARIKRDMTLEVFAQKTGYATSLLSQLERGKKAIAIHHLVLFAHVLDVKLGELLPVDLFEEVRRGEKLFEALTKAEDLVSTIQAII